MLGARNINPEQTLARLGLLLFLFISFSSFANDEPGDKSLAEPSFSVPRGHYAQPFELVIIVNEPGASLLYTIDGSKPDADSPQTNQIVSPDGDSPASLTLTVDRTMSVRARAAMANRKHSKTTTHSYIFNAQVLEQSRPQQVFEEWGHDGPDWEMDPDVVNHKDPDSRMVATDLLAIPALYLALPFGDFWGEDGIYIDGEGEPRNCSVELLNPSGSATQPNAIPGVQVNGTVQITGGSSTRRWKTDKLSMRLKFHHEALFPVFEHANNAAGSEPSRSFHTLVLDARLNESWNHSSGEQREHGQYTRDQFIADLQNDMGGLAPHGRHVHLYIAGIYWGLYTLHERPDHHFASHYLGGDKDDYDVIKHQWNDVVSGSNDHFLEVRDLLAQPDIASSEAYERIGSLLDLEDFTHYVLLNYWAGNTDWSHQNWYATFNRKDSAGRWRFHSWDAEHTIKKTRENITDKNDPDSPTRFHVRLMENPEYHALFTATVRHAMREGGLLDPEYTRAAYDRRLFEIDQAIRAESARWGDNRKRRPYTRGGEWSEESNRILNDYLPRRSRILLDQFSEAGWFP